MGLAAGGGRGLTQVRRPAAACELVDASSGLGMAALPCELGSRAAVLRKEAGIRPGLHEQLHQIAVSVCGGRVQRRVPAALDGVDVGAPLQEQGDDSFLPAAAALWIGRSPVSLAATAFGSLPASSSIRAAWASGPPPRARAASASPRYRAERTGEAVVLMEEG